MDQREFFAHQAAGFIRSTGRYSHSSEGTNFADDAPSAESYANSGRDDPRRTGIPTYLIEVRHDPALFRRKRDGYYEAHEPVPNALVTRAWRMRDADGAVVAERVRM